MPLERYDVLLRDAQEKKYAIAAFNIFGMEFLHSILKVAVEEKSPVLLQINPIHFFLSDIPAYLEYVKKVISKVPVPVGINLDHGKSKEIIMKGIRDGFPSVMFDGSKLPFEENMEQTREIVKLCKAADITVEAELGTLNDEGLEITRENADLLFTDPEKAAIFIKETGIDSLAVAIGNAHGIYKGTPKLDFDRLQAIQQQTDVPLVLHGGSGIPDSDFKKSIKLGIHKINIYTEMSRAASFCMQSSLSGNDNQYDYPSLLLKSRSAVENVVREKIRTFDSNGKS